LGARHKILPSWGKILRSARANAGKDNNTRRKKLADDLPFA